MNKQAGNLQTPPEQRLYTYPLVQVVAGAVLLTGMAVAFMWPLGHLLWCGLDGLLGVNLLSLLFRLPFAAVSILLLVPAGLCLYELAGWPFFGPICVKLDRTGLWKGRIRRPRLLFRWSDLTSVRRHNAGKFGDSWYFTAHGRRHRIRADRVARQGGAAFEHMVSHFSGRPECLSMQSAGRATEVPYRARGHLVRAEFSRDQRQLGCAILFVAAFMIPWMVTAVASQSLVVAAVVALLAGLEVWLWRLRSKWQRFGAPVVVVDEQGLWKGSRDHLRMVLAWDSLVVWRESGASDERVWTFETSQGKVDITQDEVNTVPPEDFRRAVTIASGMASG